MCFHTPAGNNWCGERSEYISEPFLLLRVHKPRYCTRANLVSAFLVWDAEVFVLGRWTIRQI